VIVSVTYTDVAQVTEWHEVDSLPEGWAEMTEWARAGWLSDSGYYPTDHQIMWIGPDRLLSVDAGE
jgi:hypothetical protein